MESIAENINEVKENMTPREKAEKSKRARKPKVECAPGEFWTQKISKHDNIYYDIDRPALVKFLAGEGFGYAIMQANKPLARVLVRVIGYVIEEIDLLTVRRHVNTYLQNFPDKALGAEILAVFENAPYDLINKDTINFLPYFTTFDGGGDSIRLNMLEDTKEAMYFPFENGLVEITKDGIALKKLDRHVWKSQIIQAHFQPVPQTEIATFEFYRFLSNVCSDRKTEQDTETITLDEKRRTALISSIGYMLHDYKTSSNKIALVLSEASLDDDPQGRTGKGLIMQAIGKLRKTVVLDGRLFSFDSQFCYQQVELDTKIMFFDDVKPKFDFRKLYSAITEGLSFERKGKDRVSLSPKESPKVAISTNYAIKGDSESDKGRKFEMELLCYYSSARKPADEFNRQFFDDWDNLDWNVFYNAMFYCGMSYLQQGKIPKYDSTILAKKRLQLELSQELIAFMDELKENQEYGIFDLLEAFKKELDKETAATWTPSKLGTAINKYLKYNGLRWIVGRKEVNGRRQMTYKKPAKTGAECEVEK